MAVLLDSVALLLWWSDTERLGERARSIIADGAEPVFASAINVWEIANKIRIGKLPEIANFEKDFFRLIDRDGFRLLDLTPAHAMRAGFLPGAHRDPFDRLLAGQALVEDLPVLTNDLEFGRFGCRTIWQ